MFVGHYGPAFAATAARKSIPLWVAFIAVQLVDVFWGIFVLLGIEKVRIVPGITATNPLDLYYMPYTHSLIGAAFWAIAGGFVYFLFRKADGWSAAAIVGIAVFSHWVLDWLVHRPDLPLYDNSLKVGLGLWNRPVFAFLLEIAVLFGGMYLYLITTEAVSRSGRYGMIVFGLVMLTFQSIVFFGRPPASDKAAAIISLVFYVAFAAVAYRLAKQRIPRPQSAPNA
jgi:hypothetical protein